MPLPDKPWETSYPTAQDTVGEEQPDLINDSYPGRRDGDRVLREHLHAIRDKLQAVALKLGDSGGLPTESVSSDLEVTKLLGGAGQGEGYSETVYDVDMNPTEIRWWNNSDKQTLLSETLIAYEGQNAVTVVRKRYVGGVCASPIFTDTITYDGDGYELTRTRERSDP